MATQIIDPRQGINLSQAQGTGGVQRATPLTLPQGYDDTIPSFIRQAAEPFIKKAQEAQFFKGYMEQQAHGAELDILNDPKNPIAKIWNSDYEQGAALSIAQTKVNGLVQGWLTDDELHKLTPGEASKKLAEDSQTIMTGNPLVDTIMQKDLLQKFGQVGDVVQRKRVAWQVQNASNTYVAKAKSDADLYQQNMVGYYGLTNPTEEQTQGMVLASQTAAQGRAKLVGQTDQSYLGDNVVAYQQAMQDGNFYYVEMMRGNGFFDFIDADQKKTLEDQYVRYSHNALDSAALQLAPEIAALHADIQLKKVSASEVQARYFELNAKASKLTGVRGVPLFDSKAITSGMNDVVDIMVADAKRSEERAYQARIREEDRQQRLRDTEEAAAKDTRAAATAASLGTMGRYLLSGGKESTASQVMAVAWGNGAMDVLAKNFSDQNGGYVSPEVKRLAQANVATQIGDDYSKGFEAIYGKWKSLSQVNEGAAAEYFGTYHFQMQAFDAAIRDPNSSRDIAFKRIFGQGSDVMFSQYSVKPSERREAEKVITKAVDKFVDNGFLKKDVNDSGKAAIASAVSSNLAMMGRYSQLPQEIQVQQAYQQARANGTLEQYGEYAWTQGVGTKPITQVTNMLPEEVGDALERVITTKAKAGGFTGKEAIEFFRNEDAGNKASFTVRLSNKDGKARLFHMTSDELMKAHEDVVGKELTRNAAFRRAVRGNGKTFRGAMEDSLDRSKGNPAPTKPMTIDDIVNRVTLPKG
ncbi:internal virion protein [Caulobacter phage Lullwater]|uniref:Internal virion protein n=1 Tax=Caulobacter phage Lullwater TaxID=2024607 RepID=A0A291LBC0_9CAUD|nr:internal virion protein [Caulobacter phage Lullwater]ATI16345.1 internal virion protein [Caulobacter phage Lullwater]